MRALRTYTTVVLAMSADGKIADRDRAAARFSSPQDLAHLETQIAQADAILFGAGTLRAYGTCLPIRQPDLLAARQTAQRPAQPIQMVCSHTGDLDTTWPFFQQPVPRWLLTTASGRDRWCHHPGFERILVFPTSPDHWSETLQQLRRLGIHQLAVLGGGTLVGDLVQQDLVDELHLTVCPLLLGGATAPTPVDGVGLPVALATRLTLVQAQVIGAEVFLHYRRCHPQRV